MTERGAGSVTLDTIIAKAVLPCLNEAFDWDTEGELFMQEMAEAFARAVTDALLAQGYMDERDWHGKGERGFNFVLPLSLRGETESNGTPPE